MSVRCQRSAANPAAEILSPPALSSHDECTCQSLCRNVLVDSLWGSVFCVAGCFACAAKWEGMANVTAVNASRNHLLNPTILIPQDFIECPSGITMTMEGYIKPIQCNVFSV